MPDQVTSTIGKSLLAPTPEVQQKIRDALDAMKNHGKQFAGIELSYAARTTAGPCGCSGGASPSRTEGTRARCWWT
jgi:hypothetical protein